MPLIRVQSHPNGPRCFIAGQRVHHGSTGIVLAVALLAARRPRAALAALGLAVHDWHDWRIWFAREVLDL